MCVCVCVCVQISPATFMGRDKLIYDIVGVQSWTSPGSNTPQDTNCTATCPLSRKLFKLDEPDMQDTAGEAEMNT